jgi:hypothetical protein
MEQQASIIADYFILKRYGANTFFRLPNKKLIGIVSGQKDIVTISPHHQKCRAAIMRKYLFLLLPLFISGCPTGDWTDPTTVDISCPHDEARSKASGLTPPR